MSRTLMSLVVFIIAVYLVLCAGLFVFQRSLIWFPSLPPWLRRIRD